MNNEALLGIIFPQIHRLHFPLMEIKNMNFERNFVFLTKF